MFGLGTWELLLIAVVVLLLFGTRLPSVMRSLGQGVVEFKKGLQGVEEDVKKIGEQPNKPQAKEEEKQSEVESAQR